MARCIAVIGAPATGKTTLVERFRRLDGRSQGHAGASGDGGTGVNIIPFSWLGEDWTALDCPGSIELLEESRSALLAADVAVICVSPEPDMAALAAPYLRLVEASGTPAIIFINRMDSARARVRDIVASLQIFAERFLCLRQIPIRNADRVIGAVDLISERAWEYHEDAPSSVIEMPDSMMERELEARGLLLEHLADYDDWLLEQIVEDREPPREPVFGIASRVLAESADIPCFLGSASHGNGIVRLMKALRHEAPGPEALAARLAEAALDATPPRAVSFRARQRRHVGRVVWLRALGEGIGQGVPLAGQGLGGLVDPETERAGAGAPPAVGAVAAAVKSDHLPAEGLLWSEHAAPPPAWAAAQPAQYARLIRPVNDRDEVKLSTALSRIDADEPSLALSHDAVTGAPRIDTQGPLCIRLLRDDLAEIFGIETEDAPVPGVYRETIAALADVHHRHRKQTGGAGQFADVRMIIAPNTRGEGFSFEEVVKGGAVPRNHIPAVEAGARDALEEGPLGFPVIDVKVTLTDGQHHSVDSSDMAFRIAGRAAVREGLMQGSPVLLQPIHAVDFHVPSASSGALVPMISSLKGQVLGFEADPDAPGWDVFRAMLPGAALQDLSGQLRSITQGVGWFDARFDHYQELYGKEAERASEARQNLEPAR